VRFPAVDLHHEGLISPEKIDLVSIDKYVHLRPRKAVAAAEVEEESLEFCARAVPVGPVANWELEELGSRAPSEPRTERTGQDPPACARS
jgi:hypothetical protein